MIALDTNVIVRVVTRDDPEQTEAARKLLESAESLWLAKTVLLETEWVLRHAYRLGRDQIAQTFRKLLGYRPLRVEDRATVVRALDWHRAGLDLADALHLASSSEAAHFATFDRKLARQTEQLEEESTAALLLL